MRASPEQPADPDREVPLAGGNVNNSVVRIGETVHRTATAHTPTIQRLLAHVRAQGVTLVPEPLGFDSQGREVLSYLAGEVAHGHPENLLAPHVLGEVGRALRQWHDATASYPRSAADNWSAPAREPAEVIVHGDFAPYNHVFNDGHLTGVIDFDTCHPAPRLWDLAWTVYRYILLTAAIDRPVNTDAASPFRLAEVHDKFGALLADWCAAHPSPDMNRDGEMYRAHAQWISGQRRR